MSLKKRLLKAARTPKQKKEVERMTESEAAAFLRSLKNKEVKPNA